MKTLALADGDLLLYRICCACEKEIDWGNNIWSLTSNMKEIEESFITTISNIAEVLDADLFHICFSEGANFRKDFLPSYKANRSNKRPPMLFHRVREIFCSDPPDQVTSIKHKEGLEADDIIGITATNPRYKKHKKVIVSSDKDFKQIPNVYLFNPIDSGLELEFISEEDADYYFHIQALMGDAVDGYSGCPGVGIKTAEKLLNEYKGNNDQLIEKVLEVYESKKISREDARKQIQVARILRYGEFSFKSSTPILRYLDETT